MKVTVTREHGNAGDVLVSLGGGRPFHIPGDVSSFTALRMLGPWLESQLSVPPPPETERDLSRVVGDDEVEP